MSEDTAKEELPAHLLKMLTCWEWGVGCRRLSAGPEPGGGVSLSEDSLTERYSSFCDHVSQILWLWQPTPVFMPGKSHGPRSLVGYNPWGRKESDTTEQLLCVFCVTLGQFIFNRQLPLLQWFWVYEQFHFNAECLVKAFWTLWYRVVLTPFHVKSNITIDPHNSRALSDE